MSYETDVSLHGTPYDYDSITHYPPTAFSKNGSETIVSKEPGGEQAMGQRDHLSEGDVKRLKIMYSCA